MRELAMEAPLLRFTLADDRPATLLLGEASTVLSVDGVDDALVSSWDLAGRPFALVRETGTYRRSLDGGLLRKREATATSPRLRERLTPATGAPVVEAARREAELALAALERVQQREPSDQRISAEVVAAARQRLRIVAAMDAAALATDAAHFLAACGPVGILPPDQYLSLVVRLTEGCSWNACTFCRLYRDVPFRARTPEELQQHLTALAAYFGPAMALRRAVFLGDANALCLGQDRLLPMLDAVAEAFPGRPLFSFVDAWTGQRRSVGEWRRLAERGLQRVYVGLESGDPALLAWLGKAGTPADAVDLVGALHESGIAAGVIVLLGAGGERFASAHAEETAEILSAMSLGPRDLLYFSEYVDDPSLGYGAKAAGAPDLLPLAAARAAEQRDAITNAFRPGQPGRAPRIASYDIREFVY
jgi:hypothetical protein